MKRKSHPGALPQVFDDKTVEEMNTHFKPKKWTGNGSGIYNDEMPGKVFSALSTGISKAAAAGELGVSAKTLHVWVDTYPEFAEAVVRGSAAGQLLWKG